MSLIQIPGSGPNLYLFQQGFVYMKTFFYIRKNQNHICTECPKSALREATHKCWDFSSWAHPQQKAEDTVSRIFCWSVILCGPVNLLVWLSTLCLFAYFSVSFFPYLSITSLPMDSLSMVYDCWDGKGSRSDQPPWLATAVDCRDHICLVADPAFPLMYTQDWDAAAQPTTGQFQWITEQKMMLPPVGL